MAIVINGSGTVTGLAVGGLPDGTVDAGTLAVNSRGTVLQVVNFDYATRVSSTSSTYVDTGITLSITPSSTSNKILVTVNISSIQKSSGDGYIYMRLLKDGTYLKRVQGDGGYTGSSVTNTFGSASISYLDSPNTTSATTYKVDFNNVNGAGTVGVQTGSGTSTITLMEIAG